jgi:hypothetical protein
MTSKAIIKTRPLGFQWETQDPFLFCVHHEDFFPKGNEHMGPADSLNGRNIGSDFEGKDGWRMYHGQKVPGFPGHPHRGFETVTVVRKGMVDHSDSLGAAGRYGDGDVQWMTAGKGLQHSEMFPLLKKEEPNTLELFQIWLNLPRSGKMVDPYFKMFWSESIPILHFEDESGNKTTVELIAGKIGDETAVAPPPDSWAANPENEVAIWNIHMDEGSEWTLPKASEGVNRTLYFYKGTSLHMDDVVLEPYHAADLLPDHPVKLQAVKDGANILVLQGKPINEPVVQHGPFVMNTREEIQETFQEYQRTQFGGWPWPEYENVHPRDSGRFAKHADGQLEKKG